MHPLRTGSLTVESFTHAIPGLPSQLNGTQLVHLSDLHYDGLRLSEQLLAEAIAATNRAQPDLIVITGDFVTDSPDPIHELVKRLKTLHSRHGIYAVLGNHDYYYRHSCREITQALSQIGVQVLSNDIAYPCGTGLAIVGFADMWACPLQPELVMTSLDPQLPRLVLCHNPDSADLLQPWRVDLQLSGHTHGGQIVLPFGPPLPQMVYQVRTSLPCSLWRLLRGKPRSPHRVVQHWEWASGLHRVGANWLYVNRGLGTYFPGRLFCPPEVTVITLIAAAVAESGSTLGVG